MCVSFCSPRQNRWIHSCRVQATIDYYCGNNHAKTASAPMIFISSLDSFLNFCYIDIVKPSKQLFCLPRFTNSCVLPFTREISGKWLLLIAFAWAAGFLRSIFRLFDKFRTFAYSRVCHGPQAPSGYPERRLCHPGGTRKHLLFKSVFRTDPSISSGWQAKVLKLNKYERGF